MLQPGPGSGKAGEGKREQAAIGSALALNPKLAPASNQEAALDAANGKVAQAQQEFTAAVNQDAQFAEAQRNVGELDGQKGNVAEAERRFRLAIENEPSYDG